MKLFWFCVAALPAAPFVLACIAAILMAVFGAVCPQVLGGTP